MDLALLEQTLADAGQPAFRAKQVWEWTARGAAGYEDMTNVPAGLREQLAEQVPFSSLTSSTRPVARRHDQGAVPHRTTAGRSRRC